MTLPRRTLILVSTGVFMSTMDSSMVNVALPTLMRTFRATLAITEWVVLVYLLTITATLLIWGRLSSSLGQGRIYGLGLLLFSLGSLSCSLSPGIFWLIGARCLQGLGAALMMAMGPALIRFAYPPEELGRGLGAIGVATSLGLMVGPAVSGLILRWSHWRLMFLLTVPLGLLAYGMGRDLLRRLDGGTDRSVSARTLSPLDGLLYAAAVTATVLLLARGGTVDSMVTLLPFFLVALVLWFFFFLLQRNRTQPLVPLALFGQRFFFMAMFSAMLSFTVLFFVLILLPFYLSTVRAMQPDQVGGIMMAVPVCVFFVAPLAGRLHDKFGARVIATTGLVLCLASLVLLTGLDQKTPHMSIVGILALLGFGQAMFLAPNSAAALAGVSHRESGVTSSLLATSRNMGMLLGTALSGLIFGLLYQYFSGGQDLRDFTSGQEEAFLRALRYTFQVGSGFAALAVIVSCLRGRGEERLTSRSGGPSQEEGGGEGSS